MKPSCLECSHIHYFPAAHGTNIARILVPHLRLISRITFMECLAILTFLHIWKNESQGYLKMQGPSQLLQNKWSYCPLKSGIGAKNAVVI